MQFRFGGTLLAKPSAPGSRSAARAFVLRRPRQNPAQQAVLPGDDEIDSFRAFALFVGLDIETDALPLD